MINFNLTGGGNVKIKNKKIAKILKSSANILKIKRNYRLSIIFVDNRKIKSLNKKYRRKNKVTDILSFDYKENKNSFPGFTEKNYLGDIIISHERLKKQAKENGKTTEQEFCSLLVHGLLHLFGYDHHRKKDRERMEKMESMILKKTFGH